MSGLKIYNNMQARRALTSVARTNGTVDGDVIDRADSNADVTFVILTATLTDGVHTFSIRESDDNSTFTDASATGSELGTAVTAATDDDAVKEIGYKGNKRYVRLRVITSGATTGGVCGAVAVVAGGRKPNYR